MAISDAANPLPHAPARQRWRDLSAALKAGEAGEVAELAPGELLTRLRPSTDSEALRAELREFITRQPASEDLWPGGGRWTRFFNPGEAPCLDILRAGIKQVVADYLAQTNLRTRSREYFDGAGDGWAISMSAGLIDAGHVPIHLHSAFLAGIYYVDSGTPHSGGELAFFDRRAVRGLFAESFPDRALQALPTRTIRPVAGDLWIWPGHYLHQVLPYHGQRPRIAMPVFVTPN